MEGLFNSTAPFMLAGLAALLSDLSGTLGIFIEGFMISGAFFSWVFSLWTGSVFLGSLLSAVLAGLTGWALARFVRFSNANPFIAGLALNLAASGLTVSLSAVLFGTKGVLYDPSVVAKPLFGQSSFTYLAWAFAFIIAITLKKTTLGLRLRASGLSPEAALERGIRPGLYMEGAWALAAFLASLAGAALTFSVGAYAPGGIAGRGYIALALVYLGFRKAWGVVLAALVFSFTERLGYSFQSLSSLPSTALLGLPSALALLFYFLAQLSNFRKRK